MKRDLTQGLVSIVIATYNQEKYIDYTINSILNQSYSNLELLLCDDCSSDNTIQIIKQWAQKDTRVIPLLSKENCGYSHNVNKGLYSARGEFLSFIDGDDLVHPEKIKKQVDFLNKHLDYDVVVHYVEVFDSNTGKTLYNFDKNILKSPDDWFFGKTWSNLYKKPDSIFPPTSYLARSSYALNGIWDLRMKYKNEILYAIDNYMVKPEAKWHCIPEYLGKYRIHSKNMHTSNEMKALLLQETYINYALAISRYPQLSKKLKSVLTYFIYNDLLFYVSQNENLGKDHLKNLKLRFRIEAGLCVYCIGILLITYYKFKQKLLEYVSSKI